MNKILLILPLLVVYCSLSIAQNYHLIQTVVGAGGTTSSSSSYTMMNTAGQPDVGSNSSSSYQQGSGFWNEYDVLLKYYAVAYSVSDGWNLISVPQTVSDYSKNALFPAAASSAFGYVGGYHEEGTLQNGRGYWLKFPAGGNISVIGTSRMTDTIPVMNKWNIIGSVAATVDTGAIVKIPPVAIASQFIGYDNGYYIASAIEPGKAYWVKSNGAGSLVLGAGSSSVKLAASKKEDETVHLNALTIEEQVKMQHGKMHSQQLLFGSGGKNINVDFYEMPPIPPKGAFDMRFASGRSLEVIPNKLDEPREISLSIQSSGIPLKLSWTMKEQSGFRYTLIERQGTKVLSQHRMNGTNSMTIDAGVNKQYSMKVENVPTQYTLYQNYPNPFNPSTTIRFDLPERSTISLKIYNVLGQEVSVLVQNQEMDEGQQSIKFDANQFASGSYFYRIIAVGMHGKNFQSVSKMMLLK